MQANQKKIHIFIINISFLTNDNWISSIYHVFFSNGTIGHIQLPIHSWVDFNMATIPRIFSLFNHFKLKVFLWPLLSILHFLLLTHFLRLLSLFHLPFCHIFPRFCYITFALLRWTSKHGIFHDLSHYAVL